MNILVGVFFVMNNFFTCPCTATSIRGNLTVRPLLGGRYEHSWKMDDSEYVFRSDNTFDKFILEQSKNRVYQKTGTWELVSKYRYNDLDYLLTLTYDRSEDETESYWIECPMSIEVLKLKLESGYGTANCRIEFKVKEGR